jgi:hypothetical protein
VDEAGVVDVSASSSKWSLWSQDSLLCIGSHGSVLSIGSVGSVLSVGSIGSAASLLSIGSALAAGSALSVSSRWSLMSDRSFGAVMGSADRGSRSPARVPAAVSLLFAVAAVAASRETRRRHRIQAP